MEDKDVLLMNTQKDGVFPHTYFKLYHIHLLCHQGEAHFTMNGIIVTTLMPTSFVCRARSLLSIIQSAYGPLVLLSISKAIQ